MSYPDNQPNDPEIIQATPPVEHVEIQSGPPVNYQEPPAYYQEPHHQGEAYCPPPPESYDQVPPQNPDPPIQSRQYSIIRSLTAFHNSAKITEHNDRNDFIKKVYTILSCQLSFTVIFVVSIFAIEGLRDGIKETIGIVFLCMILTLILCISIFCFRKVATTVPYNFIALGAFTVLESYIVGFICAFYEPLIVVVAASMALGVTIALTLYAWNTKKDFTTCGGMVFAVIAAMLLFFFFMIFFYNDVLYLIFCLFAIVMYSFFIIYDTQLIAGGRYAELTYDDYIVGSLMLYIDIIGLFLYILAILGRSNN